jgi:hypothetical protein
MLSPRGARLSQGLDSVSATACDYFKPWTYDAPLVVSAATNRRLRRVQQLFRKCVLHFVNHYAAYQEWLPVAARVQEILALCRHTPYRIGTYRTDFVIDHHLQIRLIETTCRFALNGFFTTGFFHRLAERALTAPAPVHRIDDYTPFFDDLLGYFGAFDHVCLLTGADTRNDTRYITAIFEQGGWPVHLIPADAVAANVSLLANAAVLSELDHEEISRLPTATILALIEARALNDFRTIFLLHDKRFFALLSHEAFLQDALSAAEHAELQPFLIPTYTYAMHPELFAQARVDKDGWILKPCALGKSIDVYAGPVTETAEWQRLFVPERLATMVLQEYVPQRRFPGRIGDQQFEDYIVGTLLFFEEEYYGPGLFRASSYPITNQVDDRKVAPLVTDDWPIETPLVL